MHRDDAGATADLFRSVLDGLPYYNERAKVAEAKKYSRDELTKLIQEDSGAVLVAKADTKLVGFCFSRNDDDTLWLSWFGVQPNFRRSRVGSALLSALFDRANELGAHKVWCDSRTNNQISIMALQRFGFRKVCIIPDHWYRQDFFLWEKSVA